MKVVINGCYGGFSVSRGVVNALGLQDRYSDIDRTDERFISLVEEKGAEWCGGSHAELCIVEIPNEATDWIIDEYDGLERILYVLDGKIHYMGVNSLMNEVY